MTRPYIVYGVPYSLFTRKLEAALDWFALPYETHPKDTHNDATGGPSAGEIESRSGTHQIPVLHTPENWMLSDTTPILGMLDERVPTRRLFPTGALGVLVHTLEEVLDEWVARVMVHYRWHYEENTRMVIARIVGRALDLEEARAHPLAQWGPRACRATGTDSARQREAVEVEYFALLEALEEQLGVSRYALGGRPSAVDAALLGGLRGHILHDPVPDLSTFPRVRAWAATRHWDGAGEWAPFPDSTPFAQYLLCLGRDLYQPFALANAGALRAGSKAFRLETYGEEVSYLCRPYPERSRSMLGQRLANTLSAEEATQTRTWLDEVGLSPTFAPLR